MTYDRCDKDKDDCDVVHNISKCVSERKHRGLGKNKLSASDEQNENWCSIWEVKEKSAAGNISVESNLRALCLLERVSRYLQWNLPRYSNPKRRLKIACTTIARTGTLSFGWRCERLYMLVIRNSCVVVKKHLLLGEWCSVISCHGPEKTTSRSDTAICTIDKT